MLAWLLKFTLLAALAFGFYHVAFDGGAVTDPAANADVSVSPPAAGRPAASGLLAASLPGQAGQPEVRVLVADAVDHAVLTINGRVRMEAVTMQMSRQTGEFTQSVAVDVTPTGQGIKVGAELYVRVKIRNLDSQPLRLSWGTGPDEKSMVIPHEIEIYGTHVAEANGRKIPRVRILARLPIEEYVCGVVAGEVPTSWPLEALRAQAVASRTFAYFEVKRRKNEEFDVHASTRSQVWRPGAAVEPQVRRAVDFTAGVVVTEKNALIKTFFHSECGGYTADARWVFTRTPILALSGVRCPRCTDPATPPTRWTVTYTRQEILARLRAAGLVRPGGEIRMLQGLDAEGNPMNPRQLGRVVTVEITLAGGSGTAVRIPANDFRLAMGADRKNVASTYMTISGGGESQITFSGLGWGHGVGLCQYGAAYAADKLGYGFLDILALYYPGSKPVRLWGGAGR